LPNFVQRRHAASAAGVQAAYELATLLVPQTNRAPTTTFDPNGQPILPFGRDYLQRLIDAQHADHMSKIPAGTGKTKGIEAGHEVALRVWNLRLNDNAIPPGQTAPSAFFGGAPKSTTFLNNWWNPYMVQMQTPPTGVWRQHPADSGLPCVAANYPVPFPSFNWWDTVTPFGMDDANNFMGGPPPAPNQEDPTLDLSPNCAVDPLNKFACQMEKTRALGANDSAVRTADQTSSARWWGTCNDTFAFSMFAETLSRRRLLNMAEAARVFALASIATADAFVVQKANKNRWNYWRPITSIRQLAQPDWCPLLPTPPDQEYIAGHPTVTAAGLTTLKNLFGNQFLVPITLASEDTAALCVGTGTEPPSRTFTSLDQAIEEVIMARVWGGMHYEVTGRRGVDIGRQIGNFVVANKLKPKN
jgi:hypothetical protein